MRRTKKASKQRGKFRIPYGGFHDVSSFRREIPNSGMTDAEIQALINEDRGANPAAAEYVDHPVPPMVERKISPMEQQLADRQRMMSEHWAERQRIQEESANEKQRLLLEKQQLQMEKEAEKQRLLLEKQQLQNELTLSKSKPITYDPFYTARIINDVYKPLDIHSMLEKERVRREVRRELDQEKQLNLLLNPIEQSKARVLMRSQENLFNPSQSIPRAKSKTRGQSRSRSKSRPKSRSKSKAKSKK